MPRFSLLLCCWGGRRERPPAVTDGGCSWRSDSREQPRGDVDDSSGFVSESVSTSVHANSTAAHEREAAAEENDYDEVYDEEDGHDEGYDEEDNAGDGRSASDRAEERAPSPSTLVLRRPGARRHFPDECDDFDDFNDFNDLGLQLCTFDSARHRYSSCGVVITELTSVLRNRKQQLPQSPQSPQQPQQPPASSGDSRLCDWSQQLALTAAQLSDRFNDEAFQGAVRSARALDTATGKSFAKLCFWQDGDFMLLKRAKWHWRQSANDRERRLWQLAESGSRLFGCGVSCGHCRRRCFAVALVDDQAALDSAVAPRAVSEPSAALLARASCSA